MRTGIVTAEANSWGFHLRSSVRSHLDQFESEKAGFSEVCTILRIVSEVAPVNDLRAIELFKSFRRFA
jgi:hypothetical protein